MQWRRKINMYTILISQRGSSVKSLIRCFTLDITVAGKHAIHHCWKGRYTINRKHRWLEVNDGLVDIGYRKHHKVTPGKDEFTKGNNHTNGIKSFLSYTKYRLKKYHNTPQHIFYLHLKETRFRFNLRKDDLYAILLK